MFCPNFHMNIKIMKKYSKHNSKIVEIYSGKRVENS